MMMLAAETCPLDETLGRYLARDITAAGNFPPFARSCVDGFAVRAADTASASAANPVRLTLAGSVPMGAPPERPLGPGEAMAITTGGMMPVAADTVAMAEASTAVGGFLTLIQRLTPGENMMAAGAYASAGDRLLPAGKRLDAAALGMLAAAGILQIEVFAPIQVGIISTGDELVDAASRPAAGQIRDSNSLVLGALVRQSGARPLRLGICPDDAATLKAMLRAAMRRARLVIVSGGSAAGPKDVTALVIRELAAGARVIGLPGPTARAIEVYRTAVDPLIADIYRRGKVRESEILNDGHPKKESSHKR